MNQMNMHVPMNSVVAPQNVSMQMPVSGPIMQQPSPQQMQPAAPQQPPQQDKVDNITKVKTLMGSLRECLPITLKSAAQILHQNQNIDSNTQKGIDNPVPRFDKNLEEFFSLCDQMELHLVATEHAKAKNGRCRPWINITNLDVACTQETVSAVSDLGVITLRTAVTCIQQAQSAAHYLPLTVIPSRLDAGPTTQETALSYPQYMNTVRLQISYAKDIHDTLVAAAQNISPTE